MISKHILRNPLEAREVPLNQQINMADSVATTLPEYWQSVHILRRKENKALKNFRQIEETLRHENDTSMYHDRFPTRSEKPGKMERYFPVRQNSGNFGETGKVGKKSHNILENSGNSRQMLFVTDI